MDEAVIDNIKKYGFIDTFSSISRIFTARKTGYDDSSWRRAFTRNNDCRQKLTNLGQDKIAQIIQSFTDFDINDNSINAIYDYLSMMMKRNKDLLQLINPFIDACVQTLKNDPPGWNITENAIESYVNDNKMGGKNLLKDNFRNEDATSAMVLYLNNKAKGYDYRKLSEPNGLNSTITAFTSQLEKDYNIKRSDESNLTQFKEDCLIMDKAVISKIKDEGFRTAISLVSYAADPNIMGSFYKKDYEKEFLKLGDQRTKRVLQHYSSYHTKNNSKDTLYDSVYDYMSSLIKRSDEVKQEASPFIGVCVQTLKYMDSKGTPMAHFAIDNYRDSGDFSWFACSNQIKYSHFRYTDTVPVMQIYLNTTGNSIFQYSSLRNQPLNNTINFFTDQLCRAHNIRIDQDTSTNHSGFGRK